MSEPNQNEIPTPSDNQNGIIEMKNNLFRIAAVAIAVWIFVPPQSIISSGQLDGSWMQIVMAGFNNHWQWGRDIVFTIGPYGFMLINQPGSLHLWTMALWVILGAIWIVSGWKVSSDLIQDKTTAATGLAIFSVVALAKLWFGIDALAVGFILLLILAKDSWAKYPLAFGLGLISLVHVSILISASIVILILTIESCRKYWPVLLSYCASILIFWCIAGQHPLNLFYFAIKSIPTITGYASAMSTTGGAENSDIVVWFIPSAMLLSILWAKTTKAQFFAFAFLIWSSFKHGFIRHDGHEDAAWAELTLMALCSVALCWKEVKS